MKKVSLFYFSLFLFNLNCSNINTLTTKELVPITIKDENYFLNRTIEGYYDYALRFTKEHNIDIYSLLSSESKLNLDRKPDFCLIDLDGVKNENGLETYEVGLKLNSEEKYDTVNVGEIILRLIK